MVRYVDLHCHVLPGLDDGPETPEDALKLITELESLGFTEIYPTPHQKSGAWAPSLEERLNAHRIMVEALAATGSKAILHPAGGENMWDDLFLQRQGGIFPQYPGEKSFLIEFPPDTMPPTIGERLFQFRMAGKLPVIAHVERYFEITRNISKAEPLGRSAALLVNLSSLGGMAGWRSRRLSRKLVSKGLIHGIASDAHGLTDIPYCKAGLQWLRSTLGEDTAELLLSANPRRIVNGDHPD